jgi:primosomal protein N' (replication factor Y)
VTPRVVRVLPDVPAIDRSFDYLVPDALGSRIGVGTRVRVDLHGRRVAGWVVEVDPEPVPGVELRPIAKESGLGPAADLIDLARWAAWRWAGSLVAILRTASPPRVVSALPARPATRPIAVEGTAAALAAAALDAGGGVVELAPSADRTGVLRAAAARGPVLVVCPTLAMARGAAARLRRAGAAVALHPDDWAAGAAGASVVGARAAVWAPLAGLASVVVLDEHDESLQQEQTPTWHARDVAIERARRAGVPCVLVSPCPSLEARSWGAVHVAPRAEERAGWPLIEVVDRRGADPREGLWSSQLVRALRTPSARVLCVLNRTGRARLLICTTCGATASCATCGSAVAQPVPARLRCGRCGTERPPLCLACAGTGFKALRVGVSRARDELEALVREPVAEVTAARPGDGPATRVVIGTEALLHHVDRAEVVAFVDADQELLAPRYRAAEELMALLVRAARIVGARQGAGRVLVQTRLPEHEVLRAAMRGEPAALVPAEVERRRELALPPSTAMAVVSGPASSAFMDALGAPLGLEVLGPSDAGQWLLKAPDHQTLCDALAAVPRPPGRLRIEVDPTRV